jgi:hypothetical protein
MAIADPGGTERPASSHPVLRVVRSWVSQLRVPSHIPAGRAELCARWFIENNPTGSRQQFATMLLLLLPLLLFLFMLLVNIISNL